MISFTSRGSFLGVLSLLLHSTVCLDTATVSILSEAEYAIEPNCVQSCVFKTYISSIGSFLLSELGCQSTPIYNACYCTQLADQKASTYLSSCIDDLCTGKTEVSNAISLYQNYCIGAGYPRTVAAAQTTSTSPSSTSMSQLAVVAPMPTPTSTSALTSTATPTISSATNLPSAPLSSAAPPAASPPSLTQTQAPAPSTSTSTTPKPNFVPIIGGAVGGLAGVVLISAVIYLLLRRNRQGGSDLSHGAPTTVSMQSLVRPKVELENNGVRPVEKAILAPPKPFTGVRDRASAEHGELDGGGRYVGELYAGGRPVRGVELPGGQGWKV